MNHIAKSIDSYLGHTGRYYSLYFASKGLKTLLVAATVFITVLTSAVVTHASAFETWLLEDILDKSILMSSEYGSYIRENDAPEPSSGNRFHLTMPMTVEEYLHPDVFVSGGATDPAHPKLDEGLELTTDESFFSLSEFEIASKDEWEDSAEDATEFLEKRPPRSGLN